MKRLLSIELVLVVIIVGLFLYVDIMSAWISDDSLITLTQIVNLHNADGLVFNYGERVQAFTHPTWFFLLSILTYITNNYYYTILVISIILSLSSIILLIYYGYKGGNLNATIVVLVLLLFSKAFIDYSTSGLENPLSYFLFAFVLYMLFSYKELSKSQLYILYILFAFLFLNRMDYALIIAPIVVVLIFKYKQLNIKPIILATLISLSWFIFALFYFGHIFPNTYYAKLKAGYPIEEFLERGFYYFEYQLKSDPITLIIILFGVVAGFCRKGFARAISIGLIIYLFYILKIGGDFMQGRFFAVPALISSFLIIHFLIDIKSFRWIYPILVLIIYIGSNKTSPLFVGRDYSNMGAYKGIADERGFYFQKYGLIAPKREWPKITKLTQKKPTKIETICGGLGVKALSNRDAIYYIDICALTDPLLSQLPAINKKDWRVGHQERKLPTDYKYSILNDTPLYDKKVDKLYKDIKLITHSSLWSVDRLKAIYRVNLNSYDINKSLYFDPNIALPIYSKEIISKLYPKYLTIKPNKVVDINSISKEQRDGIRWDEKGAITFIESGLEIDLKKEIQIKSLSIGFDNNDKYLVVLLNKGKIKELIIFPKSFGVGIQNRAVTLYHSVKVDKIDIFPLEGDGYYSLGWLIYK